MHSCSSHHSRCVPKCTVTVLVMHAVFHNARLQFSSWRCVPQWTIEFSSRTLSSTLLDCVFVPQCTVAVLIMTLCPTMHGWVLVMHAVFHNARFSSRSTLHGCSSRHARFVSNIQFKFSSCTLCSTIDRLSSRHAPAFHNARLQFSSCTQCSTMHGCSSRHDAVIRNECLSSRHASAHRCSSHHDAVFHNARLSSRHAHCVTQCTVEFSIHITRLQFSSCKMCSTMHGCSSRHDAVFHNERLSSRNARCVPECTVELSSCTREPLQFSSWHCVPQCTVAVLVMHAVFHNARLSSQSTLHDCSSRPARYVPQCTFAVLVMTLCSTMNGWVLVMHARTVAVLIMTLFSTVHDWLLDPHYTVAVLIMHAVFHNARL